jgi:hypothetical protein
MIRTRSFVIALAVVLLAPLPAFAQGGGQGQGRPGGMGGMGGIAAARALLEHGSVEFLVSKAAELQLTAEQTASLKEIGAKWSAETKPARDRMLAELPQPGQGMGGGDREATMQRFQAIMPLMQQLQQEDRKSLDAAMPLLSEAQQAVARRLIEERIPQRRPPGG